MVEYNNPQDARNTPKRFATVSVIVSFVLSSVTCCFWIGSVRAEYKYVSGDPVVVQQKFVEDLEAGHLDTSNLDSSVLNSITQGAAYSVSSGKINQLGPLRANVFAVWRKVR